MSSLKSKYDESRKALIFMSLNYIHSKKVCCIKNSGSIIISIANGFLCPEDQYIIPGTEFIDIYRGFDIVKKLSTELRNNCFENIRFFPTNVELFYQLR